MGLRSSRQLVVSRRSVVNTKPCERPGMRSRTTMDRSISVASIVTRQQAGRAFLSGRGRYSTRFPSETPALLVPVVDPDTAKRPLDSNFR